MFPCCPVGTQSGSAAPLEKIQINLFGEGKCVLHIEIDTQPIVVSHADLQGNACKNDAQ